MKINNICKLALEIERESFQEDSQMQLIWVRNIFALLKYISDN